MKKSKPPHPVRRSEEPGRSKVPGWCNNGETTMTGIGKKLLVWFLICSVIFAAHAFLARMVFTMITSTPEPGETIEGCMLIIAFLDFPLSLLMIPLDAVLEAFTISHLRN